MVWSSLCGCTLLITNCCSLIVHTPPARLDPSHITSLIPILQTLIADRNPLVLGTALAALENIAPGRNDLLHSQYRRLCRSLVDTDEWSQVVMLRVLERYARCEFSDPEGKGSKVSLDTRGALYESQAD